MPRQHTDANRTIGFEEEDLVLDILDHEGNVIVLLLGYCSLHDCGLGEPAHQQQIACLGLLAELFLREVFFAPESMVMG